MTKKIVLDFLAQQNERLAEELLRFVEQLPDAPGVVWRSQSFGDTYYYVQKQGCVSFGFGGNPRFTRVSVNLRTRDDPDVSVFPSVAIYLKREKAEEISRALDGKFHVPV